MVALADAAILVQQGMLEVYEPAPDGFGALDVTAIREAAAGTTFTRAQMMQRLWTAQENLTHAIGQLNFDEAQLVVRMVDLSAGLYQHAVTEGAVDPIEYQHSMGAALAAQSVLQASQADMSAEHADAYRAASGVLLLKSKFDEAAAAVRQALKLGPNLPDSEAAWHGKMSATAGVDGGMEFWIPKGANLFHFVGGARFVHGGAMPQEIVVPVVTVRHIRGKSAQDTKTKPVTVQVLGSNHRITTAYCRFQLIQMEPVGERVKPVTLRVAVYEGEEAVTDIQTVKFESASGNLDERKKWVSLVLKDR